MADALPLFLMAAGSESETRSMALKRLLMCRCWFWTPRVSINAAAKVYFVCSQKT